MIVNCEQGTAEWIQLRVGMVTAPRVANVLAKLKTKERGYGSQSDLPQRAHMRKR